MGGGGGGGRRYFPSSASDLEKLIRDSVDGARRQRLESDVNKLLREALASYERDPQIVQRYLDDIGGILKDEADMEQFLFGGSVAKHTYVDGLSDIDALVILSEEGLGKKSPRVALGRLARALQDKLSNGSVEQIEKGTIAVTVSYRDGTKIQLLPAVRAGEKVAIPNANGTGWNETKPRLFGRALTKANERLNGVLIPAIKLAKSVIGAFPKQKRLTGYHVESLSLETFKGYRGPKTVKALLMHFFRAGSERVKRPIADITEQSRVVDGYLGEANSSERRTASGALAGVAQRLESASSVEQWKAILGV